MAQWTGLSTSAYSIAPLQLPAFGTPTVGEIGWTIMLGIAAALLTFPIRKLAVRLAALVPKREFVVVPAAGFAVAAMAFFIGAAGGIALSHLPGPAPGACRPRRVVVTAEGGE